MNNPTHSKSIQTTPAPLPQLPDMTQVPLDPTNPLIWLLVLATLLTATEKPINAIANLLRAIHLLFKNRKHK